MKKKGLSLLLAASMAAAMLAGCGGGTNSAEATTAAAAETTAAAEEKAPSEEAAPAGDVELTMWSMWTSAEPQGIVLQAAADAYKEKTGVTINIEWKGRDVKNIIAAALEAGDDVDIFEDDYARINNAYKDNILDLTDMAAASGYADQSFKCFVEVSNNIAGFTTSIAEQPQVGGIFYNKDIFADCGITEIPETWEEFLAACQTMVDKGYQPMALDSAYADFWLGYHLDRVIGEAKTTELTLNGGWTDEPGVAIAGQQIIDFVNAGYLADGAPDEFPSSQNKIGLTGKVAMVVCANYVCAEVNQNTGSEINWGMFNYPTVKDGSGSTNAYAGANSLAIAKNCKNPQEAFDFLVFLTSGEFDQRMADEASQIPADPRNTAPAMMEGTVEALNATSNPLSWSMGLNQNSDLSASIKTVAAQLFENKFATGEEFAAALQALY